MYSIMMEFMKDNGISSLAQYGTLLYKTLKGEGREYFVQLELQCFSHSVYRQSRSGTVYRLQYPQYTVTKRKDRERRVVQALHHPALHAHRTCEYVKC
jgi:hypothetical protein